MLATRILQWEQEIFEKGFKQGFEQGFKQGIEQGIKRSNEKSIEKGIKQGEITLLTRFLVRIASRLGAGEN